MIPTFPSSKLLLRFYTSLTQDLIPQICCFFRIVFFYIHYSSLTIFGLLFYVDGFGGWKSRENALLTREISPNMAKFMPVFWEFDVGALGTKINARPLKICTCLIFWNVLTQNRQHKIPVLYSSPRALNRVERPISNIICKIYIALLHCVINIALLTSRYSPSLPQVYQTMQ